MSEVMRAVVSWLATYAVHSTLFLGATWLLVTLRPPRANKNRERAWKLALVGGLVSATLQSGLGVLPLFGRIDWHPPQPTRERAALAARVEEPAPAEMESTELRHPKRSSQRHESTRPTTGPDPVILPVQQVQQVQQAQQAPLAGPALQGGASPLRRAPAPRSTLAPDRASWIQATTEFTPPPGELQARAVEPEASTPLAPGSLEPAGGSAKDLSQRLSERWAGWVCFAWIAAALASVMGLAASWSGLRRRMLGRRMLLDGPLVLRLTALRQQAGMRTHVRLSVSTRVSAPFSTGLLRPEICLPSAALTGLTAAQQEVLLAHELAHLVRRDPAWFGLSTLIEKLFFFQPLNRLARRQLAEIAEIACDDWAVRWTGARLALASCLTQVAGWVIGERPRLVTPPGLAGPRSPLGRRVARLLDDRRSPSGEPPTLWWPPLAATALVAAAIAVPGVAAIEDTRPGAFPRARAMATPPTEIRATEALRVPPVGADLDQERAVLEAELAQLEAELELLDEELAARNLRERFAQTLERIGQRVALLRAQHGRVRDLLRLLQPQTTPARSSAPAAEVPTSLAKPGVLR